MSNIIDAQQAAMERADTTDVADLVAFLKASEIKNCEFAARIRAERTAA